jgi:hypothetical protein
MRTLFLVSAFFVQSLIFLSGQNQKKYAISGQLTEAETGNTIPFAYVINQNAQNGVVTAGNGSFVLQAFENDTLQFTCIGYISKRICVNQISNINDSTKSMITLKMSRKIYDLGEIYVTKIKIKPNEREYMNRVINRPKVQNINILESPITALWQSFSKKGKEMQKLEAIFTELLRKEAIEQKINTEILRKLLDDENITLEKFRIQCPEISDEFILSNNGYELYSAISQTYRFHKRRANQ